MVKVGYSSTLILYPVVVFPLIKPNRAVNVDRFVDSCT